LEVVGYFLGANDRAAKDKAQASLLFRDAIQAPEKYPHCWPDLLPMVKNAIPDGDRIRLLPAIPA
jgi:hypothetical protein